MNSSPYFFIFHLFGYIFRRIPFWIKGKGFLQRALLARLIRGKKMVFKVPLKHSLGLKKIDFLCNVDDWLPWQVFCNGFNLGEYESEKFMLSSECNKNSIIMDIGANVGYYSVLLSTKFFSSKVFAFEPFSSQYSFLEKNLKLNSLNNCFPLKLIVSDNCKPKKIYYSCDQNTGATSIHKKSKIFETVSSISLDVFCEKEKIDFIDLVKIDVEGHELNVLKGMAKLLKLKKVKNIFIEILEENLICNNSTRKEIVSLLNKFGYEGFYMDGKIEKKYNGLFDCDLVNFRVP